MSTLRPGVVDVQRAAETRSHLRARRLRRRQPVGPDDPRRAGDPARRGRRGDARAGSEERRGRRRRRQGRRRPRTRRNSGSTSSRKCRRRSAAASVRSQVHPERHQPLGLGEAEAFVDGLAQRVPELRVRAELAVAAARATSDRRARRAGARCPAGARRPRPTALRYSRPARWRSLRRRCARRLR